MKYLFCLILLTLSLFAQPEWISNPSIKGYITGIGLSNDKNPVSKRRIATVSARASLAENIKVEIKSHFKIVAQSRNDKHLTHSESIIEQKTHQVLVNSVIKDTFQDKDGTFYVLMAVELAN